MNPYNWQTHTPKILVRRQLEIARARDLLLRGEGVVLLGGRGVGKSVLLRSLERELAAVAECKVIRVRQPPAEPLVGACINHLARQLGVSTTEREFNDAEDLLGRFFDATPDVHQVILLYDELDQYARGATAGGNSLARALFDDLESTRRDLSPKLGVLAAGGLGLFLLRGSLGSSFLSRATSIDLHPFASADIRDLAKPFSDDRRPLDDATLDALRLATGGSAALTVYGLQRLWDSPEQTPGMVSDVFARFQEEQREFIRSFRSTLVDARVAQAPQKILRRIESASGEISQQELAAELEGSPVLEVDDAIRMLASAGLVRLESGITSDPLKVAVIPSV